MFCFCAEKVSLVTGDNDLTWLAGSSQVTRGLRHWPTCFSGEVPALELLLSSSTTARILSMRPSWSRRRRWTEFVCVESGLVPRIPQATPGVSTDPLSTPNSGLLTSFLGSVGRKIVSFGGGRFQARPDEVIVAMVAGILHQGRGLCSCRGDAKEKGSSLVPGMFQGCSDSQSPRAVQLSCWSLE